MERDGLSIWVIGVSLLVGLALLVGAICSVIAIREGMGLDDSFSASGSKHYYGWRNS